MRWPEPLRRATIEAAYRLGGWPRRLAALVCLAAALWSVVQDRRAPSTVTTSVVVAARDLAAGTLLGSADVQIAPWPSRLVPVAALRSLDHTVGTVIAAPMNKGEPVTAARLRGRGLTTGLPDGWVAITVVVDNAATAGLLRPGDRVDVLAAPPQETFDSDASVAGAAASVVAADVGVLAVLAPSADQTNTQSSSIVLGANRTVALQLAAVNARPLTITLRGSR